MIVRHISSAPRGGLVTGCEYIVLALSATPGRSPDPLRFMVYQPEEDGPAYDWGWWPIDLFEVVSDDVPSNWTYSQDSNGFALAPAAWLRPGHWDDLDPSELDERPSDVQNAGIRRAWSDYRSERDKILAEAGVPPGQQRVPRPRHSARPHGPGHGT